MHAIAQEGCTNTVRKSALEADSGRKNPLSHRGLEPASVSSLAFRSGALPTELSLLAQRRGRGSEICKRDLQQQVKPAKSTVACPRRQRRNL